MISALFGLALVSLWSADVASAAPGLALNTFVPTSVTDVSALEVITSIKNTGTEPLRLLNDPNSVLSTWETNSFEISRAEPSLVSSPTLNFTGILVKYSPQAAVKLGKSDLFTLISPGATVNVTHSLLGSTYDFSGKGGGNGKYKLKVSTSGKTFLSVGSDGTITPVEAQEGQVAEVAVSGRLSGPKLQPSGPGAASGKGGVQQVSSISKRALFRGCDTNRVNQVLPAASGAENMAHGAHGFLRDGPWATRRWQEWFGGWDQNRYNLVWGHYDKIRMNIPNLIYDCTCTREDLYAYVNLGNYPNVYLCLAYWGAPLDGTDSKMGIIIHEASHFTELGGTADHTYGQSNCRNLARSDPGRAAMNADSHEYFAENNPWLGQ
ncbi:unnamed protein product [Rhizoctonia solani]|uniref:Lysine-specific metallo-endopeptidase domain-containing protein n=1 Tax=Rhizoctonia solani TaxID=456999 RepID=A0A8H2XVX8_9AGAM|nr:unnamed protein product [Rhizoctonia solani]